MSRFSHSDESEPDILTRRTIALALLIVGGAARRRRMRSRATRSRCTASRRCRAGFDPFPLRQPAAPKGGRLVQGVLGSFDNLNPFIVKGLPPQGLRAPLVSGGEHHHRTTWSRA